MVLELTNTARYGHFLSLKLVHTNDTDNLLPKDFHSEMLNGISLEDNLCLVSGRQPFQGIS
jgi:hypothetical protein